MKNLILVIAGCVLFVSGVYGEEATCGTGECSCASCTAAAAGSFTLPALQGLEQADDDHAGHAHATESAEADEHAGHDHAAEEQPEEHADHAGHAHATESAEADEHAGHDHAAEEQPEEHADHAGCNHEEEVVDAHAGHDHGDEALGALEFSPEMAAKIGLKVRAAEAGIISKSVVFPAEIALNRDRAASVSPRYPSVVRQVFVEIGDTVKKGDILASLENRETLAVYTVSTPLSGTIIAKDLAVGESAAEERVLFKVADLSSVWADISIFPKYQHLIRKDMPVEFVAHDGHSARGVVKYMSPIVSSETRTFTARCVLAGADEDFTPGAFVRARIAVESTKVAVRVEREAVQVIHGDTVVFVPGDHGFEPRDVVTGLGDAGGIEIRSGLKAGEHYLAAGAFALKAELVTSGMDPHAGHGH